MRRLGKYLALTPAGRAIVRHSLLLLPAVALSLRARGMARTSAALARLEWLSGDAAGALAPAEVARLVDGVAALLRTSCLPRSLVLWRFLRRRGASAGVRLGVSRQADGSLRAHAWLEFEGAPLNDYADVLERYAALPSQPNKTTS